MPIVKKTAIINGTPYIRDVGVNAGVALGNSSKLSVAVNFDKKTIANFEGGGGNNDSFSKFKDGRITLEARQVSIALMLIALGGTSEAVAAGAVASENHTVVALDKLIALDHLQDLSIPLVVKSDDGVTTYVEGTDYVRKRAGLIPLTGGAILAADVIDCAYTKHAHQRVQALINTVTEKGLLFDGINERSNAPWLADFFRVSWEPTKSLEFIGEDFLNWTIEGEILAWDGITDPTKSKFYELKVGDL